MRPSIHHRNRNRHARPALLAFVCATFAAAATTPLPAQSDRPNLAGVWKLNAELTRLPAPGSAAERAMGPRAPVGSSGAPLGGGRGPTSVGGGGSRSSPDDAARTREAIRLALLTHTTLTITAADRSIVMTDESGRTRTLTPDNKVAKSQAGALTIESKARWDDGTLVVERKYEGDVKLTERYTIGGTPRRLTIAAKLESPGERARSFQRVYDADGAPEDPWHPRNPRP
jgi:hypothetical protein